MKNNATKTNSSSAINRQMYTSKLAIKHPLKIEQFAQLTLQSGLSGIKRWAVLSKLKTTNPGTFASSLRQSNIHITKGNVYIIKDLASAQAVIAFINEKRVLRNAEPLTEQSIAHWLAPFIERENEVAA